MGKATMIEVLYFAVPAAAGYIIYRVCCRVGTRRKTTEVAHVKDRDTAVEVLCQAVAREPRGTGKTVTARIPKK